MPGPESNQPTHDAGNSGGSAPSKQRCGIVMPISAMEDCTTEHWLEVRALIFDAVKNAGFHPELVSDGEVVGIIHQRIVQNLLQVPIVVCDVSCRNPNVMFELGLRLAFKKPTVIVMDDKTSFTFDTQPMEHLIYRRDLRFGAVVKFKETLAAKVHATSEAGDSPFLKTFGTITTPQLEMRQIPVGDYVLKELETIRQKLAELPSRWGLPPPSAVDYAVREFLANHPEFLDAPVMKILGPLQVAMRFTPIVTDEEKVTAIARAQEMYIREGRFRRNA